MYSKKTRFKIASNNIIKIFAKHGDDSLITVLPRIICI